jgi:toxin HigB-1
MIKSFLHKGLERFFFEGIKKGVQQKHLQKIADVLDLLDAAKEPNDMDFPGSELHSLKGRRKGCWSVKISGNWRITFRLRDADAFDVDYEDYH